MNSHLQTLLVYGFSTFGILLNLFLLYLIKTDKNKNTNYRRMLSILFIYNIYYAIIHCVMDVGFIIDRHGFLIFSKRLQSFGFWPSYVGVMLYVDAFTMSLTLLSIHCIYRYVKISEKWSFLFETRRWIFLLVCTHFLFGFFWVCFCDLSMRPTDMRAEISRENLRNKYNTDIEGLGYIGPVYKWTYDNGTTVILWSKLIGSIGCMGILVFTYMVVCLGCLKIYFFVNASAVSNATKRMHMQMLRVLVVQAITPLVFEYVPCISVVFGGFLWLPFINVEYFVPVFTSLYTTADALMILIFFNAYRQRCIKITRTIFHRIGRGIIGRPFDNVVSAVYTGSSK